MHIPQDVVLGLGLFGLFTSTVYSGLVVAGVRRFRKGSLCGCNRVARNRGGKHAA